MSKRKNGLWAAVTCYRTYPESISDVHINIQSRIKNAIE